MRDEVVKIRDVCGSGNREKCLKFTGVLPNTVATAGKSLSGTPHKRSKGGSEAGSSILRRKCHQAWLHQALEVTIRKPDDFFVRPGVEGNLVVFGQ